MTLRMSVLEIEVDESAMCKFLHKNRITYQKLRVTALQQDEYSLAAIYVRSLCILIDETGTDCRSRVHKRGYSVRGKPLSNHALLVRGGCVSAIACISMAGLLDVKTLTRTRNGDTFYTFVHDNLLQHLIP